LLKFKVMRKFRLTKWGQLVQLSDDEMDQGIGKDDRWTVRAGFVIAAAVLIVAGLVFDRFYNH
jgi:hypothetical protein